MLLQPADPVLISVSGEGSAEEVRSEAGFKRCDKCRETDLYRNRVPHTQGKGLAPALFKITRETENSLPEKE